jgi:hypothetical protein
MRQRTIGYFGAIALAMAPMVFTQEQPPVPQPPPEEAPAAEGTIQVRQLEGEVVEVNAQRLTVRADDGRRVTLSVGRDLTVGAEPVTVGSRVRIEYRGDQQLEVVNVSLLPVARNLEDNGAGAAARVETTPEAEPSAAPAASEREALPATASPLPILIVIGLALVGSGLGLSARIRS